MILDIARMISSHAMVGFIFVCDSRAKAKLIDKALQRLGHCSCLS